MPGLRVLVTGGSRGLGKAIGLAFAKRGARVAFTYVKNEDAAKATREELGPDAMSFKAEAFDSVKTEAAVREIEQAWGGIDVLVNNAGVTQILPIALLEEADFDAVIATNVKGPYLWSRAVLRAMIRARSGHILNIGSFASERVIEAPVHYAAAKSALRGMTEALAREVGRYNIKVNLLSPGLLDCGLARMLPKHRVQEYVAQASLGRLGTAKELAALATFLVSDDNSFMAAAKIVADGGL